MSTSVSGPDSTTSEANGAVAAAAAASASAPRFDPEEPDSFAKGQNVDGEVIAMILGRDEDFCVYTVDSPNGPALRFKSRVSFDRRMSDAQRTAIDTFTQLQSNPVPESVRVGISYELGVAMFSALQIRDNDSKAVEARFSVVKRKYEDWQQAHVDNYKRVDAIRSRLLLARDAISRTLTAFPELQEQALQLVTACDHSLMSAEIADIGLRQNWSHLNEAEVALARINILLYRKRANDLATRWIAGFVYVVALGIYYAYRSKRLSLEPASWNSTLLNVPLPIIYWAAIGSVASVLVRARQFAFYNPTEALRWLLFRPIVGIMMGAMSFLMVRAGLVVLAVTSETTSHDVLLIIAFVGGFSDTWSVGLLERIIGRAELKGAERPSPREEPAHGGAKQKAEPTPPDKSPSGSTGAPDNSLIEGAPTPANTK